MAADAERAARIRALKESRPDLTWPKIAEACDVSPRSVALWAQKGSIKYENTKPLAALFGVDRDELWAGPRESPDVMNAFNDAKTGRTQLDRIEAKLVAMDESLGLLRAAVGALLAASPDALAQTLANVGYDIVTELTGRDLSLEPEADADSNESADDEPEVSPVPLAGKRRSGRRSGG